MVGSPSDAVLVEPLSRVLRPPEVNDLVRVTLGAIDDPDAIRFASEVPSRVEDVVLDDRTGAPVAYLIAAPWFSGDLEDPQADTECALQWVTSRGLCMLPCSFQAAESPARGLRMWRVHVTGPVRREERRRFVRVSWSVPAEVVIRRDLDALPPAARQRVERAGIHALLADLPERFTAQAVNFSEGGLRCRSPEPVLPEGLALTVRFTLEERDFEAAAYVVWSLLRRDASRDCNVESALAFEEPQKHGEVLRPLMFAAQLRARRAGLL